MIKVKILQHNRPDANSIVLLKFSKQTKKSPNIFDRSNRSFRNVSLPQLKHRTWKKMCNKSTTANVPSSLDITDCKQSVEQIKFINQDFYEIAA